MGGSGGWDWCSTCVQRPGSEEHASLWVRNGHDQRSELRCVQLHADSHSLGRHLVRHGIMDIGHDGGMLAECIYYPSERDTGEGDGECCGGDTVGDRVHF